MLRALGMNVWSLTRDQAKGRNFQSYPSKGKAVFTRIKRKKGSVRNSTLLGFQSQFPKSLLLEFLWGRVLYT